MQRFLIGMLLFSFSLAQSASAQVRALTPAYFQPNHFSSPGVDAGDYVFISGQGPRRADGTMATSFAEQCRQALNNVKAIVESSGLSTQNVVYTQVYLEDIRNYAEMDRIFGEFFPQTPPARAVLGVARVPDPPIQISAIAVRNLEDRRAIFPQNYKPEGHASPGVLTHISFSCPACPGAIPRVAKFRKIRRPKSIWLLTAYRRS